MWYVFKIKNNLCVSGEGGYTIVHIWRFEDNLYGSVLLYHVGPGDSTQVAMLEASAFS